jgi:hypothetical protein
LLILILDLITRGWQSFSINTMSGFMPWDEKLRLDGCPLVNNSSAAHTPSPSVLAALEEDDEPPIAPQSHPTIIASLPQPSRTRVVLRRAPRYTSSLSPISERGEDSQASELDHTEISRVSAEFDSALSLSMGSPSLSVQSSASIPEPIERSATITPNLGCFCFRWSFGSGSRSR